tara:strand:- start:12 stop:266 length:255 start_codon:yes stop_codon:yes gene_type:complete
MIIEKVKEFGGHLSFYFSTSMTWLLGNQVHVHAMNFKDTLDYVGTIFSSLGMIIGFIYSSCLLYVFVRDKICNRSKTVKVRLRK